MSTSFPILRETTLTLAVGELPPFGLSTDETAQKAANMTLELRGSQREEGGKQKNSPLGGTGGGREGGLSED